MDMVISIISSLGIDSTLFIQLGIYLFAFVVLYKMAFKAYFIASEERLALTSGSLESAAKADEIVKKSEERYQIRARQINDEISQVFKEKRTQATQEAESILEEASKSSKKIMSEAQQTLSHQTEKAQAEIDQMSIEVSAVIVQQLLSKRGKN